MHLVSHQRLREALYYDPLLEVFYWRKSTSRKIKVGDIAEGVCKTNGYVLIGLDGFRYKAHRLAWFYMTGAWPSDEIDHKNHFRHDNRWVNLRAVSHIDNHRNRTLNKNNTSDSIGVSWHKAAGKWRAYINVDYKQRHLGLFDCKLAATLVRNTAERELNFHPNHGGSTK